MSNSIRPLSEVKHNSFVDSHLFPKPIPYYHIISESLWRPKAVYIPFDSISGYDTKWNNPGRERQHSNEEIETLQKSFSNGVQLWQELPIVYPHTEDDIKFNYKLAAGIGRVTALRNLKVMGWWFWVIDEKATTTQIQDISAFENTRFLLTPHFTTGEPGVAFHISNLIESGALENTEEAIRDKTEAVWPGLSKTSAGRIYSLAKTSGTTPRRWQEWTQGAIQMWLNEDASISFQTGGNLDPIRNKIGFTALNQLIDPFHQSIMRYAKTGQESYVVLSVRKPGIRANLMKKRTALLKQFKEMKRNYRKLGLDPVPLEILGFMYQDTEIEDKRWLVDVDGRPIKN